MLMDDSCTIYRDRPRTCRSYDCRIFAATGLAETAPEKAQIMARAGRWRFDYATPEDRERHEALRKGARYLVEQAGDYLRVEVRVVRSGKKAPRPAEFHLSEEENESVRLGGVVH